MRIGKRLQKVIDLVDTDLNVVVDIGTDHGFVALKVIEDKNAKLVYATDISEGSLKKAEELAKKYNYSDRMICVLSDGFNKLNINKANLVIIAGMGGYEIVKILSNPNNININEFILEPMQHTKVLRKYLYENGYNISYDETIQDRDKFYSVIKCKKTDRPIKYKPVDLLIGKTDLINNGEDFLNYLNYELNSYESRLKYLDKEEKIEYGILKKYKQKLGVK